MKISTSSYQAIYDYYLDTIAWMESIGVSLGKGRMSHSEKCLNYWKDSYADVSDEEATKHLPDFVASIFEIHEFIGIFESFKETPISKLALIASKLQKAVAGPIRASDESVKSTTARNYLFEAILAARAHRPPQGIEAILDAKSDTGIRYKGNKYWVECKRVTTLEGIEKNVRKASNQLDGIFNKMVGSGHRGLVALDVSKTLHGGDKLLVGKNDKELSENISKLTESFIRDYSHKWQRVFTEKNKKIVGLMIRTSYMATSEDRNLLVHVSDFGVNPRIGISEKETLLQKSLVAALGGKK